MFPARTFKGLNMQKSAITISDGGSLVRKRILSSLSTSHELDPKIALKIG
jgi:hypothetical protein